MSCGPYVIDEGYTHELNGECGSISDVCVHISPHVLVSLSDDEDEFTTAVRESEERDNITPSDFVSNLLTVFTFPEDKVVGGN